ncbi:MAG TPA: phosphotransferase [Deinococcales bacterium]|nr:phosphotransferase [Deinococcales bacterium]
MDQRTIERFTDGIRAEALARYGLSDAKSLGGFESFVFEGEIGGAPGVVKVTDGIRRTEEQLLGELDFVEYLAARGAEVARPVRSPAGKLVESVPMPDGPPFHAYAFERAPGALTRADRMSEDEVEHYGAVTGRLHALAKDYRPSRPEWRRDDWQADWILEEKHLPEVALERAAALLGRLDALPRGRDEYALLHTDLHNGNLFLHDGRLTVIDFDDCAYAWFPYDIAVVLYYAAWFSESEDRSDFAARFLASFLKGYARENRLDPQWLGTIPDFLNFRSLVMVRVGYELLESGASERHLQLGRRLIGAVERGEPILPLDYPSFARYL